MPEVWDVVIVGAGPAGSSLACRLGDLGRSVLLVDSARFPRDKLCGEYLGPGCLPLLGHVGALDEVLQEAHPGRFVRVSSPGGATFTARYPEELSSLSLPRRQLDAVLFGCAGKRKRVEVREGFRVEGLLLNSGAVCGVKGRSPGGEVLTHRARITVGADGRNSIVARSLGLFRWRSSYRKLALGRHYHRVEPAGEGAEICIGRSFYGILNHQKHGSANVSIVVDAAACLAWKGRLDAWFDALLAELPALRERLASARPAEGVRALGPLAHRAARASVDGALLAGDSAGFFDPFTGEGVYMALESARLAAGTIHQALGAGSVSGGFLRRYDIARAALLRGRYRLQAVIQAIIGCARMADAAVRGLRAQERYANRLLEVVGGLRRPAELLLPGRSAPAPTRT